MEKTNAQLFIINSICKMKIRKLFFYLILMILSGCNYYDGVLSDHYDGSSFYNEENDEHSIGDMIKWYWEMDSVEWPEWIDDVMQPPPPKFVDRNDLRVTLINQSTVLIQLDSINILTDPIWSDYAGPVSFLSANRIRKPGISLDDLPPIDIILISHDHYDHLDFPTLEQLLIKNKPIILTGLGNKSRLSSLEYEQVVELDWWQNYSFQSKDIDFTFVPCRHRSGRSLFDGSKTLWGGFVIKTNAGNILFMGDTAFGNFFNEVAKKFSPFRLTIFPIGSYEKRWFMKNQHMNPEDAVQAHIILNSKQSMGVHYATFNEHPEQSIDAHEKDLAEALNKYNIPEDKFWILKFGEGRNVD